MKNNENERKDLTGFRAQTVSRGKLLARALVALVFISGLWVCLSYVWGVDPVLSLAEASGEDWEIPNGRFFTQMGGFSVVDDQEANLWSEYQRFGGVGILGYPISRRYYQDSKVMQAFQKGILRWDANLGKASSMHIFDNLSKENYDQLLFDNWHVPYPFPANEVEPPNASWKQIVAARQGVLEANPAIKSRYFGVHDPIMVFGLPTSYVRDMGTHYALRTQRVLFQQWKQDMPWAASGGVTISNGGEISKELRWIPSSVLLPESYPTQNSAPQETEVEPEQTDVELEEIAEIQPEQTDVEPEERAEIQPEQTDVEPEERAEVQREEMQYLSNSGPRLGQFGAYHNIRVGAAINARHLGDSRYVNTIRHEFNSVTPEVEMKFDFIHPCPPVSLIDSNHERYNSNVAAWVRQNSHCDGSTQSEWNWSGMDQIVLFAEQNGLGVYGHTLSWHESNPGWLTDTGLSVAEREWVLQNHIEKVINRYCNRPVYAYDVVNEALDIHGTGFRTTGPWNDIPDYIPKAFRFAREELQRCHNNPDSVKLFYNDWDIEYDRKSKAMATYRYFSNLLSSNNPPPIDGIGFQTHLRYGGASPNEHNDKQMLNMMNLFAGLGLEIKITEIDVPIFHNNPTNYYEQQAAEFAGVARACRLVAACTGFTAWGVSDATSWYGGHLAPLLFFDSTCDDRYCTKPAYLGLQNAWQ
ncbi:MAG: endo-1,4-beta-xylanase [Ardenticatenaceae bacterium]